MPKLALAVIIPAWVALAQAPAPPAKPAPAEKPFAEVVKGASVKTGLFTLYQTQEKTYLEILPGQLDRTYLFSTTCESGLGERGIYGTQMLCGELPFWFHQSGKTIQMRSKSPLFTAARDAAIRKAVDRSFAESILGSTRAESAAHPDRKSVLIDLGALLLTDLPMLAWDLESTFRIPYRFDAKNSAFGRIQVFDKNLEVETIAHYAAERPPVPPPPSPGGPRPPTVQPPATLADVRSMLIHFRYSISEPPDNQYRARLADDRIGHFFSQVEDYTNDQSPRPTQRYIRRWRLEKADPSSALSPPKRPIVYWLENTIPVEYRGAIREGILLWNQAFERIGFKDVIRVEQQPDDAAWDPADVRYNTVRWFISTDAAFAIGPSRANPYTGELYDADISFAEAMTRWRRASITDQIKPLALPWEETPVERFFARWSATGPEQECTLGEGMRHELEFGGNVLAARGMDPVGPEADKFVRSALKWIAAHEVGHTLGLRHNFRGSTIHTLEQNRDSTLVGREGMSGSVMDYMPPNIVPKGVAQGEYFGGVLGAYDFWAIEYAYKPIDAKTPEDELPELRKIASRAAEPLLAYATDSEAGFGPTPYDMDPLVSRFDLGSDPVQFARSRIALADEVIAGMEAKLVKSGEGYQPLRRAFTSAFGQSGQALRLAAKHVGGVYHYRDHAGDPAGRLPFEPVPGARQREALTLLRKRAFAADAFHYRPDLLNKLALERFDDPFKRGYSAESRFDVPIHQMVLSLQRELLDRVLHPVTMGRILDSEVKSTAPFRLSELFGSLQEEIWSETRAGKPINSFRRGLQREHLRRMTSLLLRDAGVPEDARTLARYTLTQLQAPLRAGANNAALPVETRAHLGESVARIEEALKAQVQRTQF